MSNLCEEESGLAVVRADHGCIGHDEQDVLGHSFSFDRSSDRLLSNDNRNCCMHQAIARRRVLLSSGRLALSSAQTPASFSASTLNDAIWDHHFITALPMISPDLIRSRYSL